MAFQQGLSGLAASSKHLDVISNNVANSSTVGFKMSDAHFADLFAASLNNTGASQVGIGVSVAAVQQQFTQGNVTTTNNPLDIAIKGDGFFRMDTNGSINYSRNGQFHLDKNGFIVNDQSAKLTGYPVDASGNIVPSSPIDLQLGAADLAPVATGASVGGTFQGVQAKLNLDSRQGVPTTAWANGPATGLWSPSPTSYNYSTAVSVYDTLGNPHNLTMYFEKTAATGQWNVHANVDGTTNARVTLTPSGGQTGGPLQFNTSGVLSAASANINVSIDLAGVMTDLGKPNNAATPLAFNMNFTGSTQFGSASGMNDNGVQQDGSSAGRLSGMSVGDDGIILGKYSNDQTRRLGQVVLANFANPNGLASLGNNQWSETSTSGAALVGAPNTGRLGALQSEAVEDSNVDLTSELVNMITAQRNYQANAQSIKTQDQIMQTLVNLR